MSILPLTLTGAEVRRRGTRLIGPVDLQVAGQGTTVILGPNGAGKTTLLRLMHGIERPAGGAVVWARPRDEADLAQAFVFQSPILLRRTALQNVAFPMRLRGVPKADARRRAEDWLDRVGLIDAADRPAHGLSGGERQKLAVARALSVDPEVLFLDEPTASLDGRATREIEAILSAAAENGTRLVLTTHDLGQARRMAAEVVFLYKGRVHEIGPAAAFFEGPTTREAAAFLRGDIVE